MTKTIGARAGSVVGLALVAGFLWWAGREKSPPAGAVDPVRLSLQQVTLYRYAATGAQISRWNSERLARHKDGTTHYVLPNIQHHLPAGQRILRAGFAEQSADGQQLLLHGDVFAQQIVNDVPEMTLRTDVLTYDRRAQVIDTDAAVIFNTLSSHNRADGLQWQIAKKLFILKKNIRSVYVPPAS